MTPIEPSFHSFCSCLELSLDEKEGDWVFEQYFKRDNKQLLKIDSLEDLLEYFTPHIQKKIKETSNYKVEFLITYHSGKSRVIKLFKIFLDYLKEKKDETYLSYKEKFDKISNSASDQSDELVLSSRIMSRRTTSFSEKDIREVYEKSEFDELSGMKGKFKSINLTGNLCSDIIFKDKVEIIGGLVPKELSLSNEIENNIGKTVIKGINLSFIDSPIKLNEIEITYDKEDGIIINLQSNFIIEDLKEIGTQGTQYISKIVNNFVKGG